MILICWISFVWFFRCWSVFILRKKKEKRILDIISWVSRCDIGLYSNIRSFVSILRNEILTTLFRHIKIRIVRIILFFFKFPVDHPGICQNQKKETTKMTAKIGCNFCQKLYEFILGLEKVKKKILFKILIFWLFLFYRHTS